MHNVITIGILFVFIIVSVFFSQILLLDYGVEIQILLGLFSFITQLGVYVFFWGLKTNKALKSKIKVMVSELNDLDSQIEGLKFEVSNYSSSQKKDSDNNKELLAEVKVLQTLLSQLARTKVKPKETIKVRPIIKDGSKEKIIETENFSNEDLSEIVHNALKENRVDLYLQPIVNLPERQHVYFECFSRVRDRDGNTIFAREYLPLAKESGLISTLDNLLLFRCTQLIRGLGQKRPEVRFFCNISISSLTDEEFFPQFMDFLLANEDLKDRIIFEFAHEDVQNMNEAVEINLLKLGQSGFAFSMDQVDSLAFDISKLSQRFFKFIKIDAEVLKSGKGDIHPQDIKEALSRFEIDLIASKIEDEDEALNVLDLNIDFGQGFLFGEPKLKDKKG